MDRDEGEDGEHGRAAGDAGPGFAARRSGLGLGKLGTRARDPAHFTNALISRMTFGSNFGLRSKVIRPFTSCSTSVSCV